MSAELPEVIDDETPEEEGGSGEFVSLHGVDFELANEPNDYLLTKFGWLASQGANTDDPEAARVMLKLIKSCLTPEDFRRFDLLCEDTPTSGEDLLDVITAAIQVWSGRPTSRASGSSAGQPATSARSTDDSSSRVIRRALDNGRPDLAYAAWQAQEALLRQSGEQRAG